MTVLTFITDFLKQIGYDVPINVPRRYRRHMDYLKILIIKIPRLLPTVGGNRIKCIYTQYPTIIIL